jgi:hypothetical protein
MFLPGGLFSGAMLPWILFAPALPLLAAIIRRPAFNASFISVLVCTLVSLLTGIFSLLSSTPEINTQVFYFTLFLDMACAFLLLYFHAGRPAMQQIILFAGLLFAGIFIALMLAGSRQSGIDALIITGYAAVFLGAIAILMDQLNQVSEYITRSPAFWICAGLGFHYGLIGLLLFLSPENEVHKLLSQTDFGLLYTAILLLRYIFFSIAVFLYKPLKPSGNKRL